jgi:hypothetical protein
VEPVIIATGARARGSVTSYGKLREEMWSGGGPFLLLFGTGYGLAESIFERSAYVLEPIGDPVDWNHLSVRSAVAITLDRLLG